MPTGVAYLPHAEVRKSLALARRVLVERRLPLEVVESVRSWTSATLSRLLIRSGLLRLTSSRRQASRLARRCGGTDLRLGLVKHRWVVAEPVRDKEPLAAFGDRIADEVISCLGDAGIDYILVSASRGLTTIAILGADRRASLAALRRSRACRSFYLTPDGGRAAPVAKRWPSRHLESDDVGLIHAFVWLGEDRVEGADVGCRIEVWHRDGDLLRRAGSSGAVRLPAEGGSAKARVRGRVHPARVELGAGTDAFHCDFPVDVVYTWVDGSDPEWLASFEEEVPSRARQRESLATNRSRFTDREELRFSLRSLDRYADYVNHIWLVTAGQRPAWLVSSPDLTLVDHRDLLPEAALPTFNSHAIESHLHHIEGLSEHFLYLNDDVFFATLSRPEQFFFPNGAMKFFVSDALIPAGNAGDSDAPVDAAAKNGRQLLACAFGKTVTHKLRHTPHALRRSVLYEIEERFPSEFSRTAASRFRCPDDLSFASFLAPYYAFLSGRAQPGSLEDCYVNMHSRWAASRIRRIAQSATVATFCINETQSEDRRSRQAEDLVREFLQAYFPVPSRYEAAANRLYSTPGWRGVRDRP